MAKAGRGAQAMRNLMPMIASIGVALLLMVGLLVLETKGPPMSASMGAAVIVAALVAFLLTYDVFKRDNGFQGSLGSERPSSGARGRVTPLFEPDDVITIDAVPRNGIEHMSEALKDRRKDVHYVFRITLKPRNRYEAQALSEQLAILAQQVEPMPYVYFETADRGFVCFANAATVHKLIKDPNALGLVDLINNGLSEELKRSFGELISFTVSSKDSNADALGQMALKDTPMAMIVNRKLARAVGPISWGVLATRVLRTKA